jgi:hypothetical protein
LGWQKITPLHKMTDAFEQASNLSDLSDLLLLSARLCSTAAYTSSTQRVGTFAISGGCIDNHFSAFFFLLLASCILALGHDLKRPSR